MDYFASLFDADMAGQGELPRAVQRASVRHGDRAEGFARDLHRGLMDPDHQPEELDAWSGPAWHAATSDPSFEALQASCRYAPALASRVTADLLRMLKCIDEPAADRLANAERWQQDAEAANDPDEVRWAHKAVADAMKAAEDQGDEPDWSKGRSASKARRAARGAMKQATETVEAFEALAFVSGGGCGDGTDPGAGVGAGSNAAKELVSRSSDGRMRELAELAGRMMRITRSLRVEKERGPQEVVGICRGDDLSQVVPSEFAMLADPDTEDLFWAAYADRSLLMFDREAPTPKGKGPIVFCVDSSGSMEGTPELWSKAVLLGLADVARREGRTLAVCHFGGRVLRETSKVDPKSPEALLGEVDYFAGDYGTEFEPPLRWAVDTIETRADMTEADVVFLTDGTASAPGDWFAADKERLGFRCIGVACGAGADPESMQSFCDVTIPVSSLTANAGADIASALN